MRARLITTLLLLGPLGLVAADSNLRRISGIYSNLSYNAGGGDLLGMELLVIPAPGDASHWRALFQLAEGGGPMAVLVELTPVADDYEFSVPAVGGAPEMRFSVHFTDREAVVKNSAAGADEHLRRGRSYWE